MLKLILSSCMHTILSFLVLFLNAVFEIRRILLKKKANIVPSKSVVAITGCDSGFGEMAAIQLSKLGFLVVAGCLTEKGVTNIRDKVTHTVILDVTKEKDIQTFVNETEKICSSRNAKLWAILNNAGVADGGALDWVPMRTYRFIFEVNFFGVVAVTKAFLPLLKRNKDSRIINLSSLAGLFSSPMMTAYASSKHAVEGFAKGLRAELKPWSINVSNINPGFMRTPILVSGAEAAKALFLQAPEEIQSQYSLDQIIEQQKKMDAVKEDPQLVIDCIIDAVTESRPSMWYFPGYQSQLLRNIVNLNGDAGDFTNSVAQITPQPTAEAIQRYR